jgi:D-aminopeptidase
MRGGVVAVLIAVAAYAQVTRPRAREIGIAPGAMTPGSLNAITDVAGVRVGRRRSMRGTPSTPG